MMSTSPAFIAGIKSIFNQYAVLVESFFFVTLSLYTPIVNFKSNYWEVIEAQTFSLNSKDLAKIKFTAEGWLQFFVHFLPIPHFQRLKSNWTN